MQCIKTQCRNPQCSDHPTSKSEILKNLFEGLYFDNFGHIPLIASVSLKNDLPAESKRPRGTQCETKTH